MLLAMEVIKIKKQLEEKSVSKMSSRNDKDMREFVCGGAAAICNIAISYPLNKIIFRQMMHGKEATYVYNQLKDEGFAILYRGMMPPLIQKSLSMSLMFGVYDKCAKHLKDNDMNIYLVKAIAGIVAGTVEASLMPFERIQTLLIHPKYLEKFKNTGHAAEYIAKNYGIKEFYRGYQPILLRNGPSNALFFIIRDELKIILPRRDNLFYQSIQDFVTGASIGAFLSTLYYPLNVIKISMQSEIGGSQRTLVYEFNYIMKKRDFKFRNFYHGALLNVSRAFISWGVINASYEIFHRLLY